MYHWIVRFPHDSTVFGSDKAEAVTAIRAYLAVGSEISDEEAVEKFKASNGCSLEHHWWS